MTCKSADSLTLNRHVTVLGLKESMTANVFKA